MVDWNQSMHVFLFVIKSNTSFEILVKSFKKKVKVS